MKTLFTKEFILANCGCYSQKQVLETLPKGKSKFTIDEILSFEEPSLNDKAWFIRKNCELTDTQLWEFAIGCALCVLPIYEAKYPDNKAPREAIRAAKDYLAGIIDINMLREKRNAANAAANDADAYAYAANAANAAAAAANAYAYAYAAAAYAANAANAYAYADAYDAAYAAAAANAANKQKPISYKDLLLIFFKEFVKTNCVVA